MSTFLLTNYLFGLNTHSQRNVRIWQLLYKYGYGNPYFKFFRRHLVYNRRAIALATWRTRHSDDDWGCRWQGYFGKRMCNFRSGGPSFVPCTLPVQNWQAKTCQENSIFLEGCSNGSSSNFFRWLRTDLSGVVKMFTEERMELNMIRSSIKDSLQNGSCK